MGSYITGVVIAICTVAGLYGVHETSTGGKFFSQDSLDSLSSEELRAVAVDYRSPDRVEAILQLGHRPGDLKKTVVLLANLLAQRNKVVNSAAESSLQMIGSDGAVHLRELVDDGTISSFRKACSAMRAIGPASKIYLPELKRLLEDENTMRRKCALYALQGMGDSGKAAMDEIIVCVLDPDLNNQCSACRILESFGNDAIDAEESLLQLQKEGGPSTRGWAAVCLGAIGPTSSDVDIAETLAEQLQPRSDGRPVSPIEQQRVLTGLAYLGPEALKVADVVRKKMHGKNSYVAGYAAFALWRITCDPGESLTKLRELLNDPNRATEAVYIVSKMGPVGIDLADEVARGLRSSDPRTRELAVTAIGKMGEGAKEYGNRIRDRLDDTDAMVRMAARRALIDMRLEDGAYVEDGQVGKTSTANENPVTKKSMKELSSK